MLPKPPVCRAIFGKCTTCFIENKPPGLTPTMSKPSFESYAGTIGLNLERFKKDVAVNK